MCCLLIAGLQLLGEDLKAGGGRAARSEVGVVWEGDTFFFFCRFSRCRVRMQPGSRMHKRSRQMADSPRQVSPPVYSGGV